MNKQICEGFFLLGVTILLTGCMTCLSEWCLGKEAYQKLYYPKAYGEYWIKPGMTKETRSQDSIECGGSTRGPDFSPQQTNAARQPEDKNDFATDTRLTKVWINCMKEKGYQYTP